MRTKDLFKKTTLGLTLIYLSLSIAMTIQVERHLFEHGRHAPHHTQHGSSACTWICTTAAFIHTEGPNPNPGKSFSPESPAETGRLSPHILQFSNRIRPPPAF